MRKAILALAVIGGVFGLTLCGDTPAGAQGDKKVKVGFIYVGPKDDYGYNYEHDRARKQVESTVKGIEVMTAENIPETAEVERVMEQMIQRGAKLLFPTSYGYLDPAINVGKRHPDVVLMHAGGFKHSANVGTYWGYIYNPMYLAGLAAGKVTKTNMIGFVAAHPIPQTLQNINALTYGARSVNPKIQTRVIYTGEWCNPGKAAEAANSLIDLGADVLSQHQDCPRPVVETAAKRNVFSVGYHSADLQKFNPKGWITGAAWNWGPLYVRITQDVMAGKADRWVNKHARAGLESGWVDLAPFGSVVPKAAQQAVLARRKEIVDGKYVVFQGPMKDNKGTLLLKDGEKPSFDFIEKMNWYTEGVVGEVPR
jgi:basic membrane lipoprotein Med (substrate-binding protein (PBP1-ABC) superfamily)